MHSYKWQIKDSRPFSAGLNPCFNGRCTRTSQVLRFTQANGQCLNPCFNGRCTRTLRLFPYEWGRSDVLILVLMEDALVRESRMRHPYNVFMS